MNTHYLAPCGNRFQYKQSSSLDIKLATSQATCLADTNQLGVPQFCCNHLKTSKSVRQIASSLIISIILALSLTRGLPCSGSICSNYKKQRSTIPFYPVLSRHIPSHCVLPLPILSRPIPSHIVLSRPVRPILSHLVHADPVQFCQGLVTKGSHGAVSISV